MAAGLLLMATTGPGSGWTAAPSRLPGGRRGYRYGQPGNGLVVGGGGARRTQRDGAPGSTPPSARSGIATGIAGLGAVFASQIQHHTTTVLSSTVAGQQVLHRGGSQVTAAMQSAACVRPRRRCPGPPGPCCSHAYRIGFSHTFNELMIIGAIVAFVGAALTLVLVRQRDFVHNVVGAAAAEGRLSPGRGGRTRPWVLRVRHVRARVPRARGRHAARAAAATGVRGRRAEPAVHPGHHRAALRQLLDEGYARLSMESVASEAGRVPGHHLSPFEGQGGSGDRRHRRLRPPRGGGRRLGRPGSIGQPPWPISSASCSTSTTASTAPASRSSGGLLVDREDPTPRSALHRARVIEPRRAFARALLEQARDAGELNPDARHRPGPGHADRSGDRPGGERPPPWSRAGPGAPSTWCGVGGEGRAERLAGRSGAGGGQLPNRGRHFWVPSATFGGKGTSDVLFPPKVGGFTKSREAIPDPCGARPPSGPGR